MAASNDDTCLPVIATSIALVYQFQASLSASSVSRDEVPVEGSHPSPLLLIKAAAESLKSTTTKLSLLTITPPFTGTAISSLLKPLNESILPSLVTGVLLVTPSITPESFAAEAIRVAGSCLVELKGLLELIEKRAKDGKPESEISTVGRQAVTEATGRVWERCESAVEFAADGIPGFMVRKAEQWLALMKDAVQELQEWNPEEDVDEDLFGDIGSDDEEESSGKESTRDQDQVTIAAGVKDQVLKVLSRIPQSIHVVVKQRLAKLPPSIASGEQRLSLKQKNTLDNIIKGTRCISEHIDESAEAMYLGNPELCLKKAGEARALTIDIVESVVTPWQSSTDGVAETKEDIFIKRALLWIQQVDAGDSPAAKVV